MLMLLGEEAVVADDGDAAKRRRRISKVVPIILFAESRKEC